MINARGKSVLSRDGVTRGIIKGLGRPCRQIEGCRGWSVPVRWPDGKLTWCCTKGMDETPEGWKLL